MSVDFIKVEHRQETGVFTLMFYDTRRQKDDVNSWESDICFVRGISDDIEHIKDLVVFENLWYRLPAFQNFKCFSCHHTPGYERHLIFHVGETNFVAINDTSHEVFYYKDGDFVRHNAGTIAFACYKFQSETEHYDVQTVSETEFTIMVINSFKLGCGMVFSIPP
jgi:hypothetical protein